MNSTAAQKNAIEALAERFSDQHGRGMRSLRISVIDRCDLRCGYCMPEERYNWLGADDLLTFDELEQLVEGFTQLGVTRLRLTGGEPLLRTDLPVLIQRLAGNPLLEDLAMTTNGTRLAHYAVALRRAGLQRVTVSLDSLRPDRFARLTRRNVLGQVLAGIRAASQVGFAALKLNTVVIRNFNDDEMVDLLEFGRELGAEVRFIEYMDVGGATRWSSNQVVPRAEMLTRLEACYGSIEPQVKQGTAPADRFRLPDGLRFGIVASVTEPFCQTCDRSRLTADGFWFLCLYARQGIDLKSVLRHKGRQALREAIRRHWRERDDRGAEERLNNPRRGALYLPLELKSDLHREMHTRGG